MISRVYNDRITSGKLFRVSFTVLTSIYRLKFVLKLVCLQLKVVSTKASSTYIENTIAEKQEELRCRRPSEDLLS